MRSPSSKTTNTPFQISIHPSIHSSIHTYLYLYLYIYIYVHIYADAYLHIIYHHLYINMSKNVYSSIWSTWFSAGSSCLLSVTAAFTASFARRSQVLKSEDLAVSPWEVFRSFQKARFFRLEMMMNQVFKHGDFGGYSHPPNTKHPPNDPNHVEIPY